MCISHICASLSLCLGLGSRWAGGGCRSFEVQDGKSLACLEETVGGKTGEKAKAGRKRGRGGLRGGERLSPQGTRWV